MGHSHRWWRASILAVVVLAAFVACTSSRDDASLEDVDGGDASASADVTYASDSTADVLDGGSPRLDASDAAMDARKIPSSCKNGVANCGPDAGEDCCASLFVDGGTFLRGYDGNEYPYDSSPATISSYRLDRFEVTVGRFRTFVAAWNAGWRPAAGAGKHTHLSGGQGLRAADGTFEPGWDLTWNAMLATTDVDWGNNLACEIGRHQYEWTPTPGANEQKAIGCVSWYESQAFCIWDGGFLPSEAEWNYAAAGGGGPTGQRVFPWSVPSSGESVDCAHANSTTSPGPTADFPNDGCPLAGAKNVGSTSPLGDGAFGQADLAGNVFEYVLDWDTGYPQPCVDCAQVAPANYRVARGGCFDDITPVVKVSVRVSFGPEDRNDVVGVRCARAPAP